MIKDIGCDITSIKKLEDIIKKFPNFVKSTYSKSEYQEYLNRNKDISYLAKRFAAKEAIIKILNDEDISPSKIEILNDKNGKPFVKINNKPKPNIKVTLSSDLDYAIAYAIII